MTWTTSPGQLTNVAAVGPLLPPTQALVARFTTPPTAARALLINTMIHDLIVAGVWSKLDFLHVMAAADAQAAQRNWIADAYNLTPQNSPNFLADRGYLSNGTSSYLGTGFVPSTAPSAKMSQDDTSIGVWSLTNVTGGNDLDMGGGSLVINSRSSNANTLRGTVNAGSFVNFGSTANSLGFHALARSASDTVRGYKDGALVASTASTSGPLTSTETDTLRAGTSYSNRRIAMGFLGANLTDDEMEDFYDAALAYMQGVGAVA